MSYEMLFGKGAKGGGRIRKILEERKSKITEILKDLGISPECQYTNGHLLQSPASSAMAMPRCVRVSPSGSSTFSVLLEHVRHDVSPHAKVDALVPNLLVLPPSDAAKLATHPLVADGTLILQDRASCLSAMAAQIWPGETVLDACAAPGSKSLHALDMLKGRGRLIACEKDARRATVLVDRLLSHGKLEGPFVPHYDHDHHHHDHSNRMKGKESQNCGRAKSEKIELFESSSNSGNSTTFRAADRLRLVDTWNRTENLKDRQTLLRELASDFVLANNKNNERRPKQHLTLHFKQRPRVDDDFCFAGTSCHSDTAAAGKRRRSVGDLCVEVRLVDFTELQESETGPVDAMLVDPSCSGSGLQEIQKSHIGGGGHIEKDYRRLAKLSSFQKRILIHAMTEFPSAKRICYSTCSLHVEENQQVVEFCVQECVQNAQTRRSTSGHEHSVAPRWTWAVEHAVPWWPSAPTVVESKVDDSTSSAKRNIQSIEELDDQSGPRYLTEAEVHAVVDTDKSSSVQGGCSGGVVDTVGEVTDTSHRPDVFHIEKRGWISAGRKLDESQDAMKRRKMLKTENVFVQSDFSTNKCRGFFLAKLVKRS